MRIMKEGIKDKFSVFLLWSIVSPFKTFSFILFIFNFRLTTLPMLGNMGLWQHGTKFQRSSLKMFYKLSHTASNMWLHMITSLLSNLESAPHIDKGPKQVCNDHKKWFSSNKLEFPPPFRIKFIFPNLNLQQILLKRWHGLF